METMRAARARYFEANGFAPDGGDSSDWVDLKLGPLPIPMPNTPARKEAVKYHDLHHVLTGYQTDWAGEFEISAWELGAGCKRFYAAWSLNLMGAAAGAMWRPVQTFRAFVRGRRSRSLYGLPLEALLEAPVPEVRQQMAVPTTAPRTTVVDVALFTAVVAAGWAHGLLLLVLAANPVVLPLLFLLRWRWLRLRAVTAACE